MRTLLALLSCLVLLGCSNGAAPAPGPASSVSAVAGGGLLSAPPGWVPVPGLMAGDRTLHAAAPLPDGRVLVAGGFDNQDQLATVEIFDPATSSFVDGPDMTAARKEPSATVLADGRVLIAGGQDSTLAILDTAEIYDPTTGAFTATAGRMASRRILHTATLLPDGRVLLAGGSVGVDFVASAEIFDPSTGLFTAVGSMSRRRVGHTATLLADGTVVAAGGDGLSPSTAEIFDPGTGTWAALAAPLTSTRGAHTAVLLGDGRVLLAGGNARSLVLSTAEVYRPATRDFVAVGSMQTARMSHAASSLADGTVLVTGGFTLFPSGFPTQAMEIFDPAADTFLSVAGPMAVGRGNHTSTLLRDGSVLLVGGNHTAPGASALPSAERFFPAPAASQAMGGTQRLHAAHTSTTLSDGTVLVAGGASDVDTATAAAELWDPGTGRFTLTAPMLSRRVAHTATLLLDGRALLAGGTVGVSAELYDAGVFSETANALSRYRQNHTATLLESGEVLIAGGTDGNEALETAELFDPSTGRFTVLSSTMTVPRTRHAAARLADGRVLLVGGCSSPPLATAVTTAEIFDPVTRTFTQARARMDERRGDLTATLLPTGKVLVAGGGFAEGRSTFPSATAEVYDPAADAFSAPIAMGQYRINHAATTLADGRVLLAGGRDVQGSSFTASIFNAGTMRFADAPSMRWPRAFFALSLLADGRVLATCGENEGGGIQPAAEVFTP